MDELLAEPLSDTEFSSTDEDEQCVGNAHGASVRTRLGVPPPCTHVPAVRHKSALRMRPLPALDAQGSVGARLPCFAERWRAFFGVDGPARHHRDAEAMRLVGRGWAPQLHTNPLQLRVPRERVLAPGPRADATDALVREYVDKRMVEEVDAPPLDRMPSRLPVESLDHTMVNMPGVPFLV